MIPPMPVPDRLRKAPDPERTFGQYKEGTGVMRGADLITRGTADALPAIGEQI